MKFIGKKIFIQNFHSPQKNKEENEKRKKNYIA